jgi:hypothetical protein
MQDLLLLACLVCGLLIHRADAFAVHQGCYVSSQNGVRAFPFKAAAADSMTVEVCRCVLQLQLLCYLAVVFLLLVKLDPLQCM